ncbi:MAG: hypothetical protein KDJ55_07380, partial [Rhodobiaceae bacterium]|nr:hypothetical protein [Rhodobiaceae bacterium]
VIEDRLNASGIVKLAAAISDEQGAAAAKADDDNPPLEGPALKDGDGLKQNDIDDLLNDLF